jgi:hypothetical protein
VQKSEALSACSTVCRPAFCGCVVCGAPMLQHLLNDPLVPAVKLPHLFLVFHWCP